MITIEGDPTRKSLPVWLRGASSLIVVQYRDSSEHIEEM